MPWGNCWTYALSRWWRAGVRDSYIILRVTHQSKIPIVHAMHTHSIEGLEVSEFKPSGRWVRRFRGPFGRLMYPLLSIWFHGRIRHGLGEESREERTIAEEAT